MQANNIFYGPVSMSLNWLEKKIRKQHAGAWYGDIRSFFIGQGIHIQDFRKYAPGDSPRDINRNISAKHDALWVNTRSKDVSVYVTLVLDINTNRSSGLYIPHRFNIRAWIADYILFAHQHHITHTQVMRPDTTGGYNIHNYRTLSEWMVGYTTWESCIETYTTKKTYSSILPNVMDAYIPKKRKHIIIFFSDFLCLDNEQYTKLAYLDRKHTLLQMLIDVPDMIHIL